MFAELDELLIDKDFDYEYETIEMPSPSDLGSSLNLFRKFTGTVSEGDKIHVDMTCIENQIPISLMMFMNHTIQCRKNTDIEAVVYGQYNDELLSYALYDVTSLIYANNEIGKLDSTVDPYDVLAEILSNAKQKSETDEKNVFENADIINNIDEIIPSEDLEFFKEETSIKFQLCNVEGKTTDDNLVFQCSEENEKAAKDTDDVTINTDMNLETTSKETESGSAKKFHFSSSSKFRRAVGRYHSDKKIASNAKPIIKHNKHFC